MKKLLALLLTLAMLLSMVGTLASAEQIKPTLSYPKMTASVDEEGLLVIGFDNDVKDYWINDVKIEGRPGTLELGPDDYDADKKAYTRKVGNYLANAEVQSVNVNLNKREDGKVDDHQYGYTDGTIWYVIEAKGTYKEDKEAGTITETTSSRNESYLEGKYTGYRLEERTATSTPKDGKHHSTAEYKCYNEEGVLSRTGTETYDQVDNEKTEDEKATSYTNSNDSKDTYTENNQFGVKRTTGTDSRGEKNTNSKDKATGKSTYSWSNYDESQLYNKKGVLINTRTENRSYDGKTTTSKDESLTYDAYGNLLYGYSNEDKPSVDSKKQYNNGAMSYSEVTDYSLNEDGTRGKQTKRTETWYETNSFGTSVKSSEKVYTPNDKKYKNAAGNEVPAYLSSSWTYTEYNPNGGGITRVKEYQEDKTYDTEAKATVTTHTTKQYVGAASEGELQYTKVWTSKDFTAGGSETTTVITDYAGKELAKVENSTKYIPATETEKAKKVETSTSYSTSWDDDFDYTINSKTVTTTTTDADGYSVKTKVTTNANGKETELYSEIYDKDAKDYVATTTYNDKDGKLRGKRVSVGNTTTVTDKDGKVVYKYVYTPKTTKDGKTTPASAVYTDADGNEIGFIKYDKDYNVTSSKTPRLLYGQTTIALNGWTETTREEQGKDEDGYTLVKTETKTYNQAGKLTQDVVNDGKANTDTTTVYSLYDAEKQLASKKTELNDDDDATNTYTFNQNPNYVKSMVQTVAAPVYTIEKTASGDERLTKQVNVTTNEYFDLEGKTDRSEVTTTTTTYTYDDDDALRWDDYKTVAVTEWKNSAGSTVVTKTENYETGDTEFKKADGTVIGGAKKTTNADKSYVIESVESDFNPYTGFVFATTKEVSSYDAKGKLVKEESVRTSEYEKEEWTRDYTKGSAATEKHYYKQADGTMPLSWDQTDTWTEDGTKNTWVGHGYSYEGVATRTWTGSRVYDKEKDVWNFTETHTDENGKVLLVEEGTWEYLASGDYDDMVIENTTMKDGKGNVVGYRKTDEKGVVTEKIPYDPQEEKLGGDPRFTRGDNLNKGWKETVTDVRGNTVSEKVYNSKGQLMEESYEEASKSGYAEYWRWTANKRASSDMTTGGGFTTKKTAYYDEDGTLRTTLVNETGRASGSHVQTTKETLTDANGAVIYTYEKNEDLRTGTTSAVYKDASGKEIGHYTENKETGVTSSLYPTTGKRTGKILGFTLKETKKEENSTTTTTKTYDAAMTLLSETSSQTKNTKTGEQGYETTSYYKDGNTNPWKVQTVYPDNRSIDMLDHSASVRGGYTETNKYNQAGEKVASRIEKQYNNDWNNEDKFSLVNSEIKYFNQKGELVYSKLEMADTLNGYGGREGDEDGHSWPKTNEYTLYLDASGKEIGRVQTADNGDRTEKYPHTTYANNITGYEETITSEDGKVTITRGYDKDNKLIGETYRKENVVITDDQITTTVTKKDGAVVSKAVQDLDEDQLVSRETITYYSTWNGRYSSESRYYPETDDYRWPAHKFYDKNGNLTIYGWSWNENDWDITEDYWVNGQLQEYSWTDKAGVEEWETGEGGSHEEQYSADGKYTYWRDVDENGNSKTWYYGWGPGKLSDLIEEENGVTNHTYYDRNGNIIGYDWGMTHKNLWDWDSDGVYYGNNMLYSQDSVVWDATTALYNRHVEPSPDVNGTVETWKDYAGNVKVTVYDYDTDKSTATVTLTNSANGWHKAFGKEWYYVEGGKVVTGWKQLDGTWYYFDESGKMATGVFVDNKTTYAADTDGAWIASGWNVDEYGNWQYIENGTVVTGWKQIGGKWYYFYDGWEIAGDYDSDLAWKQYTGGNMATGAANIWNDSWSEKITYFFNADGSWDTTPGWKTNGIDSFYFYKGGQRATGWKKIGKDWYYFAENGVMRNGWVGGGSSWYYMDPETGKMVENDWIQEKFEDTWYYADKGGEMATGWREIDGDWYYFNSDGDMASQQWVKSGSDWYFMKKDGDMATGWAQDKDEKWYYMDEDGTMESSKWVGDDASGWYYVGSDGAMLTGTQTIDGRVNIFDENGLWIGYGD